MMRILICMRVSNNDYVDDDVKVRCHCHITGLYSGLGHRDCNINIKLNNKIPVIFHNLKNYDSHFIMQELGEIDLKINIISTGLEK